VCVAAEDGEQATRKDRDRINFTHRSNVSNTRVHEPGYQCMNDMSVQRGEFLRPFSRRRGGIER
jgi:hypothetical protein